MSGIDLSTFGSLEAPQLVELVRVAETAERYEDMCKFVKALVEKKVQKEKIWMLKKEIYYQ